MDGPNGTRLSSLLRRNGLALLLAIGLYFLTKALVEALFLPNNLADYTAHTLWAIALTPETALASFINGSERLWHICVRLLFALNHNMRSAAAIVTALANAAAYFLVYKTLELAAPRKLPRWLLAALTAAAFLANALTVPGAPFVTDRGYVNSWHNPTNIMVRPFAAAVFFMTVRVYNRRRAGEHALLTTPEAGGRPFAFADPLRGEWRTPVFTPGERAAYPLCLLLSVWSKPAFLQYFAPAIFVFLLIDVIRTKGRLMPFCLKMALAYLPAVLVLLSQFLRYFGSFAPLADAQAAADTVKAMEEAAGHTIYYDSESNFTTTQVAVYYILPSFSGAGELLWETGKAIVLTLFVTAFPLAVFAIDGYASRRSALCRLSVTGMVAARIESLLFHELGIRNSHGNFRWAYYVAVWLMWCAAAERYAEGLFRRDRTGRWMRWAATPLLIWHLAVGVIYIVRIFETSQYLF